MRRLAFLLLVASTPAAAFPLGLGYEFQKDKIKVTDNSEKGAHFSYDLDQTVHTFSILDFSGIVCAGFQNAHAQSEARNAALEGAAKDSSVKPGDSVGYSWKAVSPQAGTACGVQLHRASGEAKYKGQTADARLDGWTAFGLLTQPFDGDQTLFWKLKLMVDVRTLDVDGAEKEGDLLNMPFEFEVGKILNVEKVGGFFVSGMVGYDMIFWIMKSIAGEEFPTSFLRLGVTGGYQTPIENLQVRLSVKQTDQGFDKRGYKETPVSLGVFYQM